MPHKDPEVARAKRREHYYANRERILAWHKANYQATKEVQIARARSYRLRHPEAEYGFRLKRVYGITLADYQRMLDEQGGVCAVCAEPPADTKGPWKLHVDHDHATGAVRSLLCTKCNTGLGAFRDRPELLERAIAYLASHRKAAAA
jgi:hypothetical protein